MLLLEDDDLDFIKPGTYRALSGLDDVKDEVGHDPVDPEILILIFFKFTLIFPA